MKTVNFTEMKNGSKEDYELLEKFEKNFERQTADRIDRSKLELRNLERKRSKTASDRERMSQLKIMISSLTGEKRDLEGQKEKVMAKISALEKEAFDSNLRGIQKPYQEKQRLIASWKRKIAREGDPRRFVSSVTLPKLESEVRALNREYKEELKRIRERREELDLPIDGFFYDSSLGDEYSEGGEGARLGD